MAQKKKQKSWLQKLMAIREVTQGELGDCIGLSSEQTGERLKRTKFDLDEMKKMSKLLKVEFLSLVAILSAQRLTEDQFLTLIKTKN